MNVGDILDALEYEDRDREIYFTYQSGDHWQTVIAKPVLSIDEGYIEKSEYHRAHQVIEEPKDEQDTVLLIS